MFWSGLPFFTILLSSFGRLGKSPNFVKFTQGSIMSPLHILFRGLGCMVVGGEEGERGCRLNRSSNRNVLIGLLATALAASQASKPCGDERTKSNTSGV